MSKKSKTRDVREDSRTLSVFGVLNNGKIIRLIKSKDYQDAQFRLKQYNKAHRTKYELYNGCAVKKHYHGVMNE
jgi:hypothetical protein